jgi:signal transduction histidine kinase
MNCYRLDLGITTPLKRIASRRKEMLNLPASQLVRVMGRVLMIALLAAVRSGAAPPSAGALTNAADILSLSTAQASLGLGVRLNGVVTAAEPEWNGQFYVQDDTSGIFVNNLGGPRPTPGDRVEIDGNTASGPFAPIISRPRWKKLGTAPLPPAQPVSAEQLMAGVEACQRVEISGIVRSVQVENSRAVLDLATGGYRVHVLTRFPPGIDPQSLVAARVRARGTAVTRYNASLRQLITVSIYVPDVADFIVEKAETVNPFNQPVIALNSVAQYHRDDFPGKRVHVKGIVTCQRPGEDLFLKDETGGLEIETRQPETFTPGDVVEVVGFPKVENFLPVLQDAFARKTGEPNVKPVPQNASIRGIESGLHQADFITLQGKVIDRIIRRVRLQMTKQPMPETVLVLQSSNAVFTAQIDAPDGKPELTSLLIGSSVEVSGVCLTKTDNQGKVVSFQILIPTAQDVRVMQKPGWLTPRHLLICVVVVLSILILISSWAVMISKKNSALNVLIGEREKAQIELQQANDQLEERVRARTEQLEFQVTARKESELQFKAVLGERTRLAQELHDTVEQTLTGIALQLDIAAKLYAQNPTDALSHLELARNLMFRSQMEVRQSVWDLRCLVQEQFDLSSALLERARQVTSGTSIHVDLKIKGQVRALPEVVEENILRIGHEALTNVVKHARATSVNIHLEFEPQQVVLRIQDNGHGFVPQNAAGPREGHFGLLGMSERIKRLGGQFNLVSVPDKGTTVQVAIQLDQPQETLLPGIVDQQYSHEETREDTHPDS